MGLLPSAIFSEMHGRKRIYDATSTSRNEWYRLAKLAERRQVVLTWAVLHAKRWHQAQNHTCFTVYVLSTLKLMERISIDTIGTWPSDVSIKYIIMIIDTFTRYVEIFSEQEVTEIAAADALWRHTCRFIALLELVTDFGSQFVKDLLLHFHQETGIKHHTMIPHSKEKMV